MIRCIYEDRYAVDMHPLTLTRPVFDLRCGILPLREKLLITLPGKQTALFVRPFLSEYLRELYPDYRINSLESEDTLFINGRIIPDKHFQIPADFQKDQPTIFSKDGESLAAFVPGELIPHIVSESELHLEQLPASAIMKTVDWTTVRYPWELTNRNTREIKADLKRLNKSPGIDLEKFPGVHTRNENQIYLGKNVQIEPGVFLNATKGPIFLDDDVLIHANTVISGPVSLGAHTKISAGSNLTGNCSFGPVCKIGGEVTNTIIQGYSNKKHDGFLGGAYIGEWVNFGAGTNNSDLKNNYSTVQVAVNGDPVDTGERFVGCLVGDHSKFGIGSTINTGTIIGVGCNVYGSGLPPKYLPSFIWGGSGQFTEYRLDKMLETAEIAMNRREIELTPAYETMIRNLFQRTAEERDKLLVTE